MSVQINEGVASFNRKCDKPYSDNEEDQPNYVQVVSYLEQHPELLQDPLFKISRCKSYQCKSADCFFAHRGGVMVATRDVKRWAAIAKANESQNRASKPATPIQEAPPQIQSPQKPTKPPLVSPKMKQQKEDDESWEEIKEAVQNFCNETLK